MPTDLPVMLAVAGAAAIASPVGGLLSLWREATTSFLSIAVGFAAGVLLATIAFEMLPKTLELGSLPVAIGGFAAGFLGVYGFDLFIHRGVLAGEKASQRAQVEHFYRRHRPRGGEVTVLAGGTSAEELIEGLSIGVGAAIDTELGLLIALAIVIDNISEGLSIGQIVRSERSSEGGRQARRILGWTGLIGASLFSAAVVGWFLLRGMPQPVLGFLFATGAGGMFYLTMTDLVPQAEEHHYQQSAAIAAGAGFMTIFVLSNLS
jgi:ZIP family zinc transporter